jgi:hypothetical protein
MRAEKGTVRWMLMASILAAAPAVSAAGAAELLHLDLDRGTLVLSGLPDVLARPEVRPHLDSGLTSTFVVQVIAADARGKKSRGGGTVTIRWEPWDEVFLVAAAGAMGPAGSAAHRESLPSFERLQDWWRTLSLRALDASGLAADGTWQIKVSIHVVPFSESEREDTQRWFSASVESSQRSNAQDASSVAKDSSSPGLLLDLLVATSIRRHSLVSYDWSLTFRPSRGPEPRP